jgi:hypothetical protein
MDQEEVHRQRVGVTGAAWKPRTLDVLPRRRTKSLGVFEMFGLDSS